MVILGEFSKKGWESINKRISSSRHKKDKKENSMKEEIIIKSLHHEEVKPPKKQVRFLDDIDGGSLCIIHEIESYKRFNKEPYDASCACTCLIFW